MDPTASGMNAAKSRLTREVYPLLVKSQDENPAGAKGLTNLCQELIQGPE